MYTQRKRGAENHHVIETYKCIILHLDEFLNGLSVRLTKFGIPPELSHQSFEAGSCGLVVVPQLGFVPPHEPCDEASGLFISFEFYPEFYTFIKSL